MISAELARAVRDAGVRWRPVSGDRFMIERREMTGEVFTVSDMVIEEHRHEEGDFFGFNGTTEWALDSVPKADTVWLPREDQLRDLIGAAFLSLTSDDGTFTVTAAVEEGEPLVSIGTSAADAYARALLGIIALAAP